MTLKTFYMPFLFKPVKCMDTNRIVQFLYYESMMRLLCPKPSSFCANKPSLYSRNIVGILVEIIFRCGVFLNNHNNVSLPGSFARGTWRLIIWSQIWSWHLCSWAWYTSLCACIATFSCWMAWIWLSWPVMACRCCSRYHFINSCSKHTWYDFH